MTNRLQKATGVFEKWSSVLCDTTLELSKGTPRFRASVLSSLGWQSGSWTLTKKQESHLASWRARLHARMIGVRRGPEEDIGSFWMWIQRMGHQCMKKHHTSPVRMVVTHQGGWSGSLTQSMWHVVASSVSFRLMLRQRASFTNSKQTVEGTNPALKL